MFEPETDHHAEILDMLGAYALDALESDERRAVEAHVATCPSCRAQLDAYDRVVDSLAGAVPTSAPPPSLRSRLLDDARSAAPATNGAAPAPPIEFPTQPERRAAARRLARIGMAAAAVFLVAAIAVAAVLIDRMRDDRDEALSNERRIAAYLTAGGDVMTLSATGAANYGDESGRGSLVTADDMPPIVVVDGCPPSNDDRRYRVWVARGADRMGVGDLTVDSDGTGWLELDTPEPLTSYDTLGVTMVIDDSQRSDLFLGTIDAAITG